MFTDEPKIIDAPHTYKIISKKVIHKYTKDDGYLTTKGKTSGRYPMVTSVSSSWRSNGGIYQAKNGLLYSKPMKKDPLFDRQLIGDDIKFLFDNETNIILLIKMFYFFNLE